MAPLQPWHREGCERPATRNKQSVSGARTLRAGTQSVQALSGRARSNTVGEGRNNRRRYSYYMAISVPAVTACVADRRGVARTLSTRASFQTNWLIYSSSGASPAYVGNTRIAAYNTVFYSYLACFMNTFTLNMYVSMSHTGVTRRNTVFVFLWLRPRNT